MLADEARGELHVRHVDVQRGVEVERDYVDCFPHEFDYIRCFDAVPCIRVFFEAFLVKVNRLAAPAPLIILILLLDHFYLQLLDLLPELYIVFFILGMAGERIELWNELLPLIGKDDIGAV